MYSLVGSLVPGSSRGTGWSYCCSFSGAANPFSSLGTFSSSSIGDPVFSPMDGCSLLAQKFRIPRIQFIEHMKLKKKEDQSVDISVLLRRGTKIHIGGVTGTKCGAETEGKPIQRLSHLWNPSNIQSSKPEVLADRSLI